ncbi:P-loop containing nucleoside triphosphate hydrolase protein [Xylariaceae sp. FL1019]|nr:P-loop containing nucleoside triphosphate hydrolase protein [Xylariaceae sp. FL1019]
MSDVSHTVANMSDGVVSISDSSSGASETRAPRNIAHPAFADIGLKLKACNDTLGELQLLGINHATLPELVLVGDQSSGKSSLMSALAQLDLPTSSDVKKSNPFPPWVPKQLTEVKLFKTIYENDPVDVDVVLRWAQIATLNPSTDSSQYVPEEGSYARETELDDARGETETKFSPNVVALEMKGPGFPDLSFYDLPGVFAVASNRSENYLVSVVENLTRRYVSRPEAKIMLALPMSNDIETSRTFRIIRDLNAEDRTVGVIADKADWNTNAKVSDWAAVFAGEKHAVEKGFFITSLPPEADKSWEDNFFRHGTSSWPRAFDAFALRCGVDHLRRFITKELGDSFSDSLPDIKLKVENRLGEIELELNELPELPQNVEYEVRTSLKNFHASVKIAMNSATFERRFKELNQEFHKCLIRMRPGCSCDTTKKRKKQDQVIILDDDSEDEHVGSKRPSRNASVQSTPKRPRTQGLPVTPIKYEEPRLGSMLPSPASIRPIQMLSETTVSFFGGEFRGVQLHLTDIKKEIASATRPGFSGVVPLEVHETLSLKAISRWNAPLSIYIQQIVDMLMEAVAGALHTSFENLRHRLICHLSAFLKDQGKVQGKRLEEIHGNETYRVSTMNENGMEQHKAVEKKVLERYRLYIRAKAEGLFDTQDKRLSDHHCKLISEKKPTSEAEKDWARILPGDTFSREIDLVATVIDTTAATRFVDGISMDANGQVFRKIREGAMDDYLEDKLGLSSYPSKYQDTLIDITVPANEGQIKARETYERLMEENEETACRRKQLKREKEKLRMAAQRILALEGSCSSISYTVPYHDQQGSPNDAPIRKLEQDLD